MRPRCNKRVSVSVSAVLPKIIPKAASQAVGFVAIFWRENERLRHEKDVPHFPACFRATKPH